MYKYLNLHVCKSQLGYWLKSIYYTDISHTNKNQKHIRADASVCLVPKFLTLYSAIIWPLKNQTYM